jgi:hypothetical protein
MLLPPCPDERIEAVERALGDIPPVVKDMLGRFNGGTLFKTTPLVVRLLGVSPASPYPPEQWPAELCIDHYTAKWRANIVERRHDWVIAVTRLGGADQSALGIICDADGFIHKRNLVDDKWVERYVPFREWMGEVVTHGDALLV